MKNTSKIHNGELQEKIIATLIQRGKNEKWNNELLSNICDNLGAKGAFSLLYPNGINDITDLLFQEVDQAMLENGNQYITDWIEIQKSNTPTLEDKKNFKVPIHRQIAFYLYARFDYLQQYKEILPNILKHLANPINAKFAAKMVWRMADIVWSTLGDTSTDYNYYSKRFLLGTIYCTSVIHYLQDNSINHQNTRLFIDKRLNNVLSIHKFKAKLMSLYKPYL